MTSAPASAYEYLKLKELLFRQEQQALHEVQELAGGHHQQFGTRERFTSYTAEVLPGSVREAHALQSEKLTAALSPVILAGLQHQLRHSREEMIAALYPVMGKLMSAYAAKCWRDFAGGLNRRLEGLLTLRILRLSAKSLFTGVPYAVLLAAETQPFQVRALFLIRRSSGILADHWFAAPEGEALLNGGTEHPAAALPSPVIEFGREAFAGGDAGMKSIRSGGATYFLRASPDYLVAVKCTGLPVRRLERRIAGETGAVLEQFSVALSQAERLIDRNVTRAVLPELAARLHRSFEEERPRPVLAIAFLAVLLLLCTGWAALHVLNDMHVRRLEAQAVSAVASLDAVQGYPIRVTMQPGAAIVSGLVPSAEAGRQVISRVSEAVRPAAVQSEISVLSAAPAVDTSALTAQVAALQRRLDETATLIASAQFESRSRLQQFEDKLIGPQHNLGQWLRSHAIFFSAQTNFRDPAETGRHLRELRDLLITSGAKIRVAGYTDPAGTAETNGSLAQARANYVIGELTRLGVPASQLKAIGRPSGQRVSQDQGLGSNNRRVEFELLFEGEAFKDAGVPAGETGGK
jgi:outer membrane protein OmpA-like peptidoglycan-associated protein